jgi:hypothetical protein
MSLVLDKPAQIEAFRLLAITKGLEIELRLTSRGWPATAGPTRGLALRAARATLRQYEVQGPPTVAPGKWPRTRKQALAAMQQLLKDTGVN